jgi:hypothetical protein
MRTRAIGSLLLLLIFASGSAPARAATDVQRFTFKGSQVFIAFMGSASITCADGTTGIAAANGFLNGAQQIISSTGTPTTVSNGVLVSLTYFNSCTNAAVGFADGTIVNGLTPPDKNLNAAALAGSTVVQDVGSGQTVPVTINVSVVGDGTLSQSKSNSHGKIVGTKGGPLQISTSHFANSNRSGTASGTISVDGIALNPDFIFASLVANDNSSMTVSKL